MEYSEGTAIVGVSDLKKIKKKLKKPPHQVDVIVWVDEGVVAFFFSGVLKRDVRHNLVDVHIRARA